MVKDKLTRLTTMIRQNYCVLHQDSYNSVLSSNIWEKNLKLKENIEKGWTFF